MIKFFRNIRRKLLSENKPASPTGKYLLYAIGEIVLVVIGILIALQLNMWRESGQDKQAEKSYLIGILNNLNEDIYELNNLIERDTTQLNAYAILLKSFTDKSINTNSREFIKAVGDSYANHWFTGNSIVFEDMKSSGKVNLISSDVLRFSILEYYNESLKLADIQGSTNSSVITPAKNEAFLNDIDLNSLVENFIIPYRWRSELDELDLSFFNSDINNSEVKQFANRLSILKAYLFSAFKQHDLLLIKAERLKDKISTYIANGTVSEKTFLPKEIFSAIKAGDIESLKKLVPETDLNNCYETGFDTSNLIAISIYENSLASLKYFVESGADLELVCANKTSLMYTAKYGRLEMLKYLLEQGALMNTVSIKGKTALSYSIQYKEPEIEAYLRSLGANL